MKKQTFTNTVNGGMIQDIDRHEQPNNSYRYAIGGRIIQNSTEDQDKSLEENVKSGVTRAFVNAKGNKYALSLCPGYKPIGSCETQDGAIIFSTNNVNSEIGFMEINDNVYKTGWAKYTTLFNDRSDPNGDLLRFNIDKYVNGSFSVLENEFTERIYWVDGYNQKRVINLKEFYKPDGTTYHNQTNGCDSVSVYPKHLSVHAFDERMDLYFPKIKFWKRLPDGALKSGLYQILIKYVSKNGHTSVWSPLSQSVFVTDQKMDGDITIGTTVYPNAYQLNHHNRTMGASNIVTEEGLAFNLVGLDTRWDQIKVAYVYHASSTAFQEATDYKTIDITGPSMTIELIGHTGVGLSKEEINQRYETVLSVGSTAQQENRTWDANMELLPDFTFDLSEVKIKPHFNTFRPDVTLEPKFNPVFNPVSGRDDGDPFTNSFPINMSITTSNFTGNIEQYGTFNDYVNYKGQLFNFLYKGYFRGETQPFSFLFLDRKGNPLFAQHIRDFTFPNQFDTKDADGNDIDATLAKHYPSPTVSPELRIMGAMFSNIKIPVKNLYDKFGKLNVSAFMIVRTERINRVANQGVLYNCIQTYNDDSDTDQDKYVQPLLWISNKFSDEAESSNSPNSFYYEDAVGTNYEHKFSGSKNKVDPALSAPFYFNYYSPDIFIEGVLPKDPTNAQIQTVGFAHKTINKWVEINGMAHHVYSKNFKTTPIAWPLYYNRLKNGRPALGSKSRVNMAIIHTNPVFAIYDKFDAERGDVYDYRADVWVTCLFTLDGTVYPGPPGVCPSVSASQQRQSLILKLSDFAAVDFYEDNTSTSTMVIANWLQTPDKYYTEDDVSSLNARRYFSTGHFQQITQDILDQSRKVLNEQGQLTHYAFDDVEVWGGDCYVNQFDFSRLIPEYTDCSKQDEQGALWGPHADPPIYPDYSVSNILPIESKYNLALLYGRKFAANGINPQMSACGDNSKKHMVNGIMLGQPENWYYNEVLLLQESTKFYFPKPVDSKIISLQESTVRWSPKKLYGEQEDSYRQRLTYDYADVIGEFGAITKMCQGFDYLYIIQEKAFGAAMTKVERFIPTTTGDIMVKSGDAFGGMRYISKVYGTRHPNSVTSADNRISFTDASKGKILVFNQAGLRKQSEEDFMDDPISSMTMFFDKNITHQSDIFVDIIAGIDFENSEIVTTFFYRGNESNSGVVDPKNREDEMKTFTLGYSTKIGVWQSYHHFKPTFYFNIGRYFFSPNPKAGLGNELFVYNHGNYGQWFREYYPTILEYIVNPQPNVEKTFDNSFINVDEDGASRIVSAIHRANKNTHTINLTNIDNAEFIEGSLRYPIYEEDLSLPDDKPRVRGHYMVARLIIDNSLQLSDNKDTQVAITNIDTLFRLSSPFQY